MNTINKLTEYFSKFPGIGPRQSKRFVYFLLSRDNRFLDELANLILNLKKETTICEHCYRYFPSNFSKSNQCEICSSKNRDTSMLMVIERDSDFENVEKNHIYNGLYFILGGTLPILEKNSNKKIRVKELLNRIEKDVTQNGLKEIILATGLSTEGENTKDHLMLSLKPMTEKHSLKITLLGRGLSTGTELEYIDSNTMKNALENRR